MITPAPGINPGTAPSKSRLAKLREQRRVRRIMRALVCGQWREVLIGLEKTQHRFTQMGTHSGKIGDMLVKIDFIDLAIDWHATVFASNPITISLPQGYETQAQAINAIRHHVLFDAKLGEAIEQLNTYGDCAICATVVSEDGVVIQLEDSEVCFATGEDRADGQPSQWDRRWIIERVDPANRNKKLRFLRIQRHTVGLVQELAFRCESDDVLQDEMALTQVPLATAIGDGPVPADSIETGVPYPLIVRLVSKRRDGESVPLVRESDLDLIDAFTAAVTRVMRIAEKHGDPKFRVPQSMIDPKDGKIDSSQDGIVDPDKEYEAILVQWDLAGMLELMTSVIKMLLVRIKMSQALLGYKPDGGVDTDTYEKMKLGSSNTLAHAHKTAMYCTPALERLWFIVSILDARQPTKGYSTVAPAVRVHPEIPKDQVEIAREQKELYEAGLTSLRRACVAIHGDDEGEEIYAEIVEEQNQKADLEARKFTQSFGKAMNTGDPKVDDANAAGGVV